MFTPSSPAATMHQHCQNYARSRHAVAGDGLPVIEPGMPAPAGTGLTRRSMMLRSLGLGVAVYGAGAVTGTEHIEAAINDALGEHKVVISVFFDGGWDSLSVLAPFGTDHKHEARAAERRPWIGNAYLWVSAPIAVVLAFLYSAGAWAN